MDNTFDKMFYCEGDLIAGIDETGLPDMAGPLVAACVILPKINLKRDDLHIFEVWDSKSLHSNSRENRAEVIRNIALGIGIGEVSPIEIDYLTVGRSLELAHARAIAACKSTTASHKTLKPDFLLIDGNRSISVDIKQKLFEDGDKKSLCVASAGIIAKVYRDNLMKKHHERFPFYEWNVNKGFICEAQLSGMDKHGIQIGVHRTRGWPFARTKKFYKLPLNEQTKWEERRKNWWLLTEERLRRELWPDTRDKSSIALTSSENSSKAMPPV